MAKTGQGDPDNLKLERQLCFPLYAVSRLVIRQYQPILEPLGLTYPQYVAMLVLWAEAPCTVSHLGLRTMLRSNTLTPLLKRMETQGLIVRTRSSEDERVVNVALTEAGTELRTRCTGIPERLASRIGMPLEEMMQLKTLLDDLMTRLGGQGGACL